MDARRHIRMLVESALERHFDIAAAVEEIVSALDDELEARVVDRVADLCQQLKQTDA
jgi:hypothetical protein